jgi:acetoin utilization deacetylase AcuC-like enzyme
VQQDPCIQFVDFHRGGDIWNGKNYVKFYPGTGSTSDDHRNVINVEFANKYTYAEVKTKWDEVAEPAIKKFQPNLIIICAGFDAHKHDPMGAANLTEQDFGAWTRAIMSLAANLESCHGRIISLLEGGYDTNKKTSGLRSSVEAHLKALVERVNIGPVDG